MIEEPSRLNTKSPVRQNTFFKVTNIENKEINKLNFQNKYQKSFKFQKSPNT
jgi:hypothetical protein